MALEGTTTLLYYARRLSLTLSIGFARELDEAAAIIDEATAVLIVAGAGIGVDSGLPDYRGPTGFWKGITRS